jgi:hypothetical protein
MTFTLTRDYEFTKTLADNLRKKYENNRRDENESVHVSDIIPSSCLRKQYYGRKFPEKDTLSDETVYAFIRGESSEHIITQLANIGAAQCRIEHKGIVARPDILRKDAGALPSSFLVVELKDSASLGKRLRPGDFSFDSYLNQLLYYLVISEVENGVLCIKYSTHELIWYQRNSDGDHYVKPPNSRPPGIGCWHVYLSMNDPLRAELEQEMVIRKAVFLSALKTNDVEILPRVTGMAKRLKCKRCPFMTQCWTEDDETQEAMRMATEPSIVEKILLQFDSSS